MFLVVILVNKEMKGNTNNNKNLAKDQDNLKVAKWFNEITEKKEI